MALGKKYMLKRKVKDPETGEEIWVEHKPDIAWFGSSGETIRNSCPAGLRLIDFRQAPVSTCRRPWFAT
ncbi:MAG: hypothetical protein WA746_31530, partial [Isosphaeraceae bacterium]